jgi:serine O-acetyltransferase
MEDRYIAQALLERLRADGLVFRVLGDKRGPELEVAVPRGALAGMPRALARFAQELDLRMVQLARPEQRRWRVMLAWSDQVGRPRFLGAEFLSDYYRGARRLLGCEELLAGTPDVLFIHDLLEGVERGEIDAERGERLTGLWHEDARGAMERLAHFWTAAADLRLISQAAKRAGWAALRPSLPALRRALHRRVGRRPAALVAAAAVGLRRVLEPPGAAVVFMGREGGARADVMGQVARDLAPLGLELVGDSGGRARRADFRVVFDAPKNAVSMFDDAVAIGRGERAAAMAAEVEGALLRWLECRIERRHPAAAAGENPPAARLLQLACRRPLLKFVQVLFNCDIACALRSPLRMPYPFGVVIEHGVVLGSHVTVMQHVMIGRAGGDSGFPVIEDNVTVGAGAKILGPVRVGRGATVGANAVVTRDVPSHCTVVGANRILGQEKIHVQAVVEKRQEESRSVVNT